MTDPYISRLTDSDIVGRPLGFEIGQNLFELGRYEDAIASYDKALKIKPDQHEAWNNRGIALHQLGRYEDAIASYDKALDIKPDKDEAWANRSVALQHLGRLEKAIESYDHALINITPNHANALYNKVCSYSLLNKPEEALKNLKRSIELDPVQRRQMAKTDSDFDSLREDERFRALIQ